MALQILHDMSAMRQLADQALPPGLGRGLRVFGCLGLYSFKCHPTLVPVACAHCEQPLKLVAYRQLIGLLGFEGLSATQPSLRGQDLMVEGNEDVLLGSQQESKIQNRG